MFLDFLKRQPIFRKFFFRKEDEAQQLFLELSKHTQISGLSFLERQFFIGQFPSKEEVQRFHESLTQKVDDFIAVAQGKYPDMHEISKADAKQTKSTAYAAKIFTCIDEIYLVFGVFFYQKLSNTNYWKRMEEPPATAAGKTDPRYSPPLYTGYPETVEFSYCGIGGDVNYLRQENFTFFTEKFYSVDPVSDSSDMSVL